MATSTRSNQSLTIPQVASPKSSSSEFPTFLEHVLELRQRIFWVIGFVLIGAGAAFALQDQIIRVITLPLGSQQLYYLTPAGGLSFVFKICAYAGLLVAVPLVIYHLYRYLEPLIGRHRRRVVLYTGLSVVLAIIGVVFAYTISLPAALHFLTGFNLENIQAMLTADAYLSFVIVYLLGSAILFQVPLILLIINSIKPLTPSKLFRAMRYVVPGAFIVGAIITPTPDVVNQLLIALPVIGMYLLGIFMVWVYNSRRPASSDAGLSRIVRPQMAEPPEAPSVLLAPPTDEQAPAVRNRPAPRSIDGVMPRPRLGRVT